MVVFTLDGFDTEIILRNENFPASHLWACTVVEISEITMINTEDKVSVSQKILVLFEHVDGGVA